MFDWLGVRRPSTAANTSVEYSYPWVLSVDVGGKTYYIPYTDDMNEYIECVRALTELVKAGKVSDEN